MAVYTPLSDIDANRVCEAHGLGPCSRVEPIAQGSVNSNFFVHTARGARFLRIYEEQEAEGVRYEWELLEHLRQAGLPVPHRAGTPAPGEVRVEGKPVAIFELVGGQESCQAAVTPARAAAVGTFLAEVHRAGETFGWQRQGRFELDQVMARLEAAPLDAHPELRPVAEELADVIGEIRRDWPAQAPRGLIHGDLFRDNVRWEGDRIVAAIDWESASHGLLAYDLMVTVLAWCYGDAWRWDLAKALVQAYRSRRPMDEAELGSLRVLGMAAASRFTVTRITDFYLRQGIGKRVCKDYQRFLARLRGLRSLDAQTLAHRLTE